MENVKESTNVKQQHESNVNEAENFDTFMKAMVQVVEKYGCLFCRNWIVLRKFTQPYISHFPKYRRW